MSHKVPVKKTFLRKGEGIARFGMKKLQLKKKSLQGTAETVKDSEPTPDDRNVNQAMQSTVNALVGTDSKPFQINNHQFAPSKVCVFVCVYVCIRVCMCVYVCACMYTCVHVCM